jgi:hypothetical protein
VTDRELIAALIGCATLTEWEEEAFHSMKEWLDGGENRSLSERQREVATKAAHDKGVWIEPSANLWSSGKVPRGIVTPKTDGEKRAAAVLKDRPTRPPGRSAS